MKRYYAMSFIAIALLFTGCMKQDLSDCEIPDNLVLKPELHDENGASVLAARMSSIDAFVYDTINRFVAHKRVEKQGTGQFPQITFTLQPGKYRVICWGNNEDNTSLTGLDNKLPFTEAYLETISDKTGDPLYYAPKMLPSDRPTTISKLSGLINVDDSYTVTVSSNQITVKEMNFSRAHRTVNVFINGYESEYEKEAPTVRFTNVPLRADFLLQTDPARKSYSAVSGIIDTEKGERHIASFHTPIASLADNMEIEIIRSSNNQKITGVGLKKYVEDNLSKIKDTNEIDIEITFAMNGLVQVECPDWQNNPIKPEW